MKNIRRFLYLILFLALGIPACTQIGEAPESNPIVLTNEQDRFPLGLNLEILEDPEGDLTIEDVTSPLHAARFAPSMSEVPNFGFTESSYWGRFSLRNETLQDVSRFLEIGFAHMQFIDLYTPLPDGTGFSVKQTGAMRPPSSRDITHPRFVFDLTLPAQSEQTYYLRFENDASMTLPLTLWKPSVFWNQVQLEEIQRGIFFGLILGLLAYNLFLAISLRDRNYLYLTFVLASMLVFEASYSGFAEIHLIPTLYPLKPYYFPLLLALLIGTAVLFSDSFLEVKRWLPKLHWANIGILGVWGLLTLLIPFASYHLLAVLMVPWAIVSLAMILIVGVISWRRGYRPAKIFLLAWSGLALTMMGALLVRITVLPSTFNSEYAYYLGFMWMAVCWSLALAERINILKAETDHANQQLRDSEHRLAEILEGIPLGVVVYGKEQKPSFSNQRAIDLLSNPAQGIYADISRGRTLEEAIEYLSLEKVGSGQKYPIAQMPVARALQGEMAIVDDIEANLVDKRVPLEIIAAPVRNDVGEVEAAVVAFQDVTARKQSEMALQASEKRLRVIFENAFDGIVFMAQDRKVLYVSPSYLRMNGMQVEDVIGKSGVGFVHPEDQVRVAQVFGELLQRPGGKVTVEYRSRHQNGSWFWVETNAVNLLDDPRVTAVVLNIRDITTRKKTEAVLAQHRRHLELLVAHRTAQLQATNGWLSALKVSRQTVGGSADLPRVYDELSAKILHLLDVQAISILIWNDQGEQVEAICRQQQKSGVEYLSGIQSFVHSDSSLRQAIEQGQLLQLTADEVDALPAALGKCFHDQELQSLILAPMMAQQTVIGVFSVVIPPAYALSDAQVHLIENIAHDLADLNGNARLLDQSHALVAVNERNRLARDLHDSVTQTLFTASVMAEATPRIFEKDQKIARTNLGKLSVLLRSTLAEMRTLLLELRSGELSGQSLKQLLTTLVEAAQGRSHIRIELTAEDDTDLPDEVTQAFYRIAREAINNIIVHSEASRAAIVLTRGENSAELCIRDNGVGFKPEEIPAGHLGLNIMGERAAQIGANLQIQSEPGQGSDIRVTWSS